MTKSWFKPACLSFENGNAAHDAKEALRRILFVVFGFHDFFATVKTVRADVVTQVSFASYWLNCDCWTCQKVVRTVHTAF